MLTRKDDTVVTHSHRFGQFLDRVIAWVKSLEGQFMTVSSIPRIVVTQVDPFFLATATLREGLR